MLPFTQRSTPRREGQRLRGRGDRAVRGFGRDVPRCAILLADRPWPDVKASLALLREDGIKRIVMLTGDNAAIAATIAKKWASMRSSRILGDLAGLASGQLHTTTA